MDYNHNAFAASEDVSDMLSSTTTSSSSSSSSSSLSSLFTLSLRERTLTYLDSTDPDGTTGLITDTGELIGFSILGGGFCWTALMFIYLCRGEQNFYEWNAIRLILPGITWILALDCVTLAMEAGDITIADQWRIALYMLQSLIAPGIFLSTFVITFLAYRTRSIPFCLMERGPGRSNGNNDSIGANDEDQQGFQPLIRPATMIVMVRLSCLALGILTMLVNFDTVWSSDDLAGRTGWRTILQEPWNGSTAHVYLSLLPMAIVSASCLYFSFLLWRYGAYFSMIIYPSVFNAWLTPGFGTGCMITGQLFGPDLFPLLSRAGILIFLMCLLRVEMEVKRDMNQAGDLGNFLDALGDDAVTGSVTPPEKSGNSAWGTARDDGSSTEVGAATSGIGGGGRGRGRGRDVEEGKRLPHLPSIQ